MKKINTKTKTIVEAPAGSAVKVTVEPISKIKFKSDNPRKHSKQNLALIEKSLQENKAGRSILIDENNETIAGEGTTQSARAAGIKNVIVVEVSGDDLVAVKRTDLTTEQKTALAILDNSATDTSEWNFETLQQNLIALQSSGKNLNELGFSNEEIQIFTQSDFTKKVVIDGEDSEAHKKFTENLQTVMKFSHAEMESITAYSARFSINDKQAILQAVRFASNICQFCGQYSARTTHLNADFACEQCESLQRDENEAQGGNN